MNHFLLIVGNQSDEEVSRTNGYYIVKSTSKKTARSKFNKSSHLKSHLGDMILSVIEIDNFINDIITITEPERKSI